MNISMDSMKHSLWHKITSYFLTIFMAMQFTLPSVAVAMTSISNEQLSQELSQEQMFIRSVLTARLYERSKYIPPVPLSYSDQTIAELHSKLKTSYLHRLPSEIVTDWIPIAGDITIFIPSERATYPLGKTVGDTFVQRKLIGNQIKRLIGRTYYQPGFSSEQAQIQQLYSNALTVAGKSTFTYQFGNQLPEGIADTIKADFIWPENRNIGGEYVLIPVVHLQTNTVEAKGIDGTHTVEFRKSNATFKSAKISNSDLKLQNDTVFRTINDLVIGTKSSISIDASAARIYAGVSFIDNGYGSVQGIATGTLYNYGQINSERNVDIVAGNYQQKTFVHRFKTPHGYQDRLGSIASINAGGGISIRTYNNMLFEAATVTASGGSINLYANGNINIGAVSLENASSFKMRGGKRNQQGVNYVQSILSAQDNISLYAAGLIEIIASELHADKGVISILADNGIYILNEFDESSSNMDRKWGNTTETEQEFETIAIRSVLQAGKGITIASNYGDITLKATHISSGEGTKINARNGHVNLLLAKEQDHYFYNKVKKGLWKIKTHTIQDQVDTAVYNEIIGGVKVKATHGITLELGQKEGQTSAEIIGEMGRVDGLSWMQDVYDDPAFNCPNPQSPYYETDEIAKFTHSLIKDDPAFDNCINTIDVVYQKLVEIHKDKKTSNLSPAAMAIIAIAVAVAIGPAGFELIGVGGSIGSTVSSPFLTGAMQAAASSLATQAATGIIGGKGIDGTLKSMISKDSLKSLAISMVTAGVLRQMGDLKFFSNADQNSSFFTSQTAVDIANQATQAVAESTIRSGISTLVNGGDLSQFSEQFKVALIQYGINELGEHMAGKIGEAFDNNPDSLDTALKYISHAASGCIIGAATAKLNDNEDPNLQCAAGAGGAVVGEYIASNLRDSAKYIAAKEAAKEAFTQHSEKNIDMINALLRKEYTPEQISQIINQPAYKLTAIADMNKLRQQGVDLAKLGAALGVFIAGADANAINIAAKTGATAAEFNTFSRYSASKLALEAINKIVAGLKSTDGLIEPAFSIAADAIFDAGIDLQIDLNELSADMRNKLLRIPEGKRIAYLGAILAGLLDTGAGLGFVADVALREMATQVLNDPDYQAANIEVIKENIAEIENTIENFDEIIDAAMSIIETADVNDLETQALIVRFSTSMLSGAALSAATAGVTAIATPKIILKLFDRLKIKAAEGKLDLDVVKDRFAIEDIKAIDTNNDGIKDTIKVETKDSLSRSRLLNLPEGYTILPDGSIKGPNQGIAFDSQYLTTDKKTIFRRQSGGYYYIDDNGVQQTIQSPRETGDFLKVANVWAPGVHYFQRGKQIEEHVWEFEYKPNGYINTNKIKVWSDKANDWVRTKSENFPLIDFQKGQTVISLKSVNTEGSSWISNMQSHIKDLSKRSIKIDKIEVPKTNRILDIRVEPGGANFAEVLRPYAHRHGITLRISEFGG